MIYRTLGKSGLNVSILSFGTLSISPLQAALSPKDGAAVIRSALELGVNLVDTAQLYRTYPAIREALKGFGREVFVVSKSYASEADEMRRSVEEALRETGLGYLGGFLLHEQESALTLKGHRCALDELIRLREKGIVRAVGISTHAVAAVRSAALLPEVDVIHPLYNRRGLGVLDGSAGDMLSAIRFAHDMGKGIYAMKVLAGGHLHASAEDILCETASLHCVDSIAVGMKSVDEVRFNCAAIEGLPVPEAVRMKVRSAPRRLHVEDWCRGCGACVSSCPFGALEVSGSKVQVAVERCMLCGYCASSCTDFCLKVV